MKNRRITLKLEKVKKDGQAALTLLSKDYQRLEKEEETFPL